MADLLLPPWLSMASIGFRYVDSTGMSVGEFTGAKTTAGKGGDRLAATLEFSPQATSSTIAAQERATLISILSRLRGRQNRIYMTNPARRLRGSFPAAELFPDNTFASGGLSSWAQGSAYQNSSSVYDRVAHLVLNSGSSSARSLLRKDTGATVTPFAPYVIRAMVRQGRGSYFVRLRAGATAGAVDYLNSSDFGYGLATASFVPWASPVYGTLLDVTASGLLAGDFIDVPWMSLSRCALVDDGQNWCTHSDDFSNAAWTKTRCTVAATAVTLPDGATGTVNTLHEDSTAAQTHFVEDAVTITSTSGLDWSYSVTLKAANRTWARIGILENSGGTLCVAHINLSTGAVGTITPGTNWADGRAYSSDMGNGWWKFTIVARKTINTASADVRIYAGEADGDVTFDGLNQDSIYMWRSTFAKSSVPTRLVQTTGSALTTGTPQSGSALHLKGLPPSVNGLLLNDDEAESITTKGSELKLTTAQLASDGTWCGYWQFEPPLRGVPADNSPVIVHEPMGYFLFTGDLVGWDNEPGLVTRSSAELEEAA